MKNIFIILMLVLPFISLADQTVQLLEPSVINQNTVTGINAYLDKAFPVFIALISVLAVLMIAWGGLEYMLSKLPGAKTEGKERIKQALWGLLLALAAWIILETINPKITTTQLTVPPVNQQ